jgi:pimeloyl-ACP methyl ester carboxylesterase
MLLYSNIIGQGQPFLILHGFLGMSDNWKSLGKKFSANDYEVHLIDQRNHGRSFHHNEFNYEVMVSDLKSYCDNHNLRDLIILGHSMGGKTAMLFASMYPDYVSKLIVADIAPRYYPIHHTEILNGLISLKFDEIETRKEADEQLKQYVFDFGIRQFLLKNLYWADKGRLDLRVNLKVLMENVGEVGEALPNYLKFDKSTLFLRGDKSEYISIEDESGIKTQFKRAKIVTINNAGHWLHAENPKDFFESVMNFISNN